MDSDATREVTIVGAGAAGLATAIFLRRANPQCDVLLVDGARKPGAKILVSGGGRCNVTNTRVTERDFHGGSRRAIRQVLSSLPVAATLTFFRELGVMLHEEEHGKLFPDSGRARQVLDALLAEAARLGVERRDNTRVTGLTPGDGRFTLQTGGSAIAARRVVLATGGLSIPKSGSDGTGLTFARGLGHTVVVPVPALVPLRLAPSSPMPFDRLAGVSHEVEVGVWLDGRIAYRIRGSLLWTHFGVSGPAALDASRHWTRAEADGRSVRFTLSFCAGERFETVDARLRAEASARPRASVGSVLSMLLPASVAEAVATAAGLASSSPAASVTREERRRLTHVLTECALPIDGTRGYGYAEVTAGGVALGEIDPRTMASRVCAGLYIVGEALDVDGRIGGFNFQWAWASGHVAGCTLARESGVG